MEQAMKVIERIADSLIRQNNSLGSSQAEAEAQQMQSLSYTSCRRNFSQ